MSPGFSRAINSRWRDIAALVTAVLLTRWLFMAEYLVHMDSVNFALGIVDYNPVVHQPHPPGYYLYVLLGKLLTYYTHDPVLALFFISISASSAGVVFLYLLTLEWFGRRAALFSGLLFLTSPFGLFYETVGLTYIVEFSLVTLVGLLCWHVSQGQPRYLIAAA